MQMTNVVLIRNNVPAHKKEDVQEICEDYGFDYIFDPPYSPMFNIIEVVINDIKNTIKTQLVTTMRSRVFAIASVSCGQKTLKRTRLHMETLNKAMSIVTPEIVISHLNHYLKILADAIAFKDL